MRPTFVVLISLLIFSGCSLKTNKSQENQEEAYYHSQGKIFGTFYNVKYEYNRSLEKEITDRLNEFDLSLNPFNKQSIIYKVNNNLDPEVDKWFKTVFLKAQEVSGVSSGTYDVTAAPLINLWGFGYEKLAEPTPEIIDSLKEFVGYQKIRLEGNKIVKDDPRVQVNFSSIAKGYSCDIIAELLDSIGSENYMVEIGGEIKAKGRNPRNTCWKIQIDKPIDDISGSSHEQMDMAELCNMSMATSGNYRNFYIKNGKKYAHTIDPISGYPAESNVLSATVFHKSCMVADAFATAFMTMDLETAVTTAKSIPDLEYVFIYAEAETGEYNMIYSYK